MESKGAEIHCGYLLSYRRVYWWLPFSKFLHLFPKASQPASQPINLIAINMTSLFKHLAWTRNVLGYNKLVYFIDPSNINFEDPTCLCSFSVLSFFFKSFIFVSHHVLQPLLYVCACSLRSHARRTHPSLAGYGGQPRPFLRPLVFTRVRNISVPSAVSLCHS